MTATLAVDGQASRMALSSLCRDDRHKTCSELRMQCACDCHRPDARNVAQPQTRKSRLGATSKARPARHVAQEPKVEPVGKRPPVIALVKADPPALTKPSRVTLAGQVRPLLEEILVGGDRDWYRVVLFFKARQASMNLKRLRDAHSKTEWEWQARKLDPGRPVRNLCPLDRQRRKAHMIAAVFWLAVIAAGWWWATRPARRTRQDRADLARIRARRHGPRCLP